MSHSIELKSVLPPGAIVSRGRNGPVGGVDDDADGGERQAVRGRKPGDEMRLHVHGHRPGERAQPSLIRGVRNDGVDADDRAMPSDRDHLHQLARPKRIGRPQDRMIDDRGCYHAIAGDKIGRESACDAEADDAAAAGAQRDLHQLCRLAAAAAADHKRARSCRDTRFERQPDQSDDGPFRRA